MYDETGGALAATTDARLPLGALPCREEQEAGTFAAPDSSANAASNFASRFALPW